MTGVKLSEHPYQRSLVDAFVSYWGDVMGGASDGRVQVLEGSALPDADAAVALVFGKRSRRWYRRAALRGFQPGLRGGSGPIGSPDPALPVVLLDKWDPASLPATPKEFDVLAIMAVYNEADIIGDVLDYLRQDGIRVHLMDNWSDDGTSAIVQERAASDSGIIVEQFPSEGSSGYFELEKILTRVEEIAHASGADWVINYDADEIRTSPWPGISLRRGLYAVDQFGFNCVDHTIVNFRPVDESWVGQGHLANAFEWFEFGDSPSHFRQPKAWKPPPDMLHFADMGGHDTTFEGRRVFPYKFITRHFPIRSSAHGQRKILRERQLRWSPEERAKGWHVHYDEYSDSSSFLWDASTLLRFADVDQRLLLERLSGVTLPGGPYQREAAAP